MPEDMMAALEEAREDFPNKRIIAHFVQPHQPYVSDWALDNLELPFGLEGARQLVTGDLDDQDDIDREEMTTYLHLYREGEIDHDTIWKAYEENLDLVLTAINSYLESPDERVVVTADHGEMFRDNGWPYLQSFVGHYSSIRAPELNKVPWLVVEGKNRPTVKSGEIMSKTDGSTEEIKERLAELGYLDG